MKIIFIILITSLVVVIAVASLNFASYKDKITKNLAKKDPEDKKSIDQ